MEPIFTHDTDGKELKDQSVLGRRSTCHPLSLALSAFR